MNSHVIVLWRYSQDSNTLCQSTKRSDGFVHEPDHSERQLHKPAESTAVPDSLESRMVGSFLDTLHNYRIEASGPNNVDFSPKYIVL